MTVGAVIMPLNLSKTFRFGRFRLLTYAFSVTAQPTLDHLGSSPSSHYGAIGTPVKKSSPLPSATTVKSDAMTRMLIPVWENLASYMQDPFEKRRDYFSQWKPAPEWAIDRNGNTSFYDKDWGCPPARVGRDPRYRPLPQGTIPDRYVPRGRMWLENVRFGNFGSPTVTADNGLAVSAGLERRFAYGRM